MRIELDPVAAPAGPFGSEQGSSASSKRVQNNSTSLRAVEDGVADEGKWFRRGVSGEGRFSVLSEAAHAGILPDVSSASAKSAQFDVVHVLCATILVDEYEFVG